MTGKDGSVSSLTKAPHLIICTW